MTTIDSEDAPELERCMYCGLKVETPCDAPVYGPCATALEWLNNQPTS